LFVKMRFLISKKKILIVLVIFCLLTGILFSDFIFKGLLPIPSDALVGGYYPWRDEIWLGRTAGFPIKNFNIRDVIRQLYPWRQLAIEGFKKSQVPLWNPYNFTGTPHLANIFVAAFYPFNIIFFVLPFPLAWGIYVAVQPIFVALAFFIFLKNLKLKDSAAIFGSIIFAFSSFLMSRMEFGMVGHTAMWLPLSLLSIDKLSCEKRIRWWFLATFSLACSLLAGYFQVTIYTYLIFIAYGFFRFWGKQNIKNLIMIFGAVIFALFLTGFQLFPFLQISLRSDRINNYGQESFFGENFFLPFERLITFFIPDFFGNDATGNFWGETSYYEFSGYIGIISLFFVFFSIFLIKKVRSILFWLSILLLAFVFALPTPISLGFYNLGIPGFSVLIPARIIFIIDFSLAVLAGFGFHYFQESVDEKTRNYSFLAISILVFCFFLIALVFLRGVIFWSLWQKNFSVSLRNSVLPLSSLGLLIVTLPIYLRSKSIKIQRFTLLILFFCLCFNLLRNSKKYNPFVDPKVLFPRTKVIDFLKNQSKPSRILITDQELMTANTNIPYDLQMVDGYDSVHSQRFQELAVTANSEDPSGRFESPGRSIFLTNYRSPIFDLANVKYVLALEDIINPKLKLVFRHGKTRVYENIKSYPRVYLTRELKIINKDEEILKELLRFTSEEKKEVILEESVGLKNGGVEDPRNFKAEIIDYQPQNVKIITEAPIETILVFSDAYDPGWKASIDGQNTKVLRANYNFRAVVVPAGDHEVIFSYQPTSFKIGILVGLSTLTILLVFMLTAILKRSF